MDHVHTAWGDEIARLEFRPVWKGVSSPWRHLAKLLPGQSWFELPEPDIESQSQVYVVQKETPPIPPEAMAAMDLVAQGASDAFVIENWLGIGIMNHKLVGAKTEPRITDLIEAYKTASGKKRAGGFPDVVAFWPDQSVSICEVMIRGKDELNQNQIDGVDHLRTILGPRLDLRIYEWPGVREEAQPKAGRKEEPVITRP